MQFYKSRKGYFFILDAMLGLITLVIGVFLITSAYVSAPQSTQVAFLSEDLMRFLSNTKVKDLNNIYAGIGGSLQSRGYIEDPSNSLLQQIGEFYEKSRQNYPLPTGETEPYMQIAQKFVQNVSEGSIPWQFRYAFCINGEAIYPVASSSCMSYINSQQGASQSVLLRNSRNIAFGILINDKEIWGPYKAEVFVWES